MKHCVVWTPCNKSRQRWTLLNCTHGFLVFFFFSLKKKY